MNVLTFITTVTNLIVIAILIGYTVYGTWFIYRRFFAPYALRVADTKQEYLRLKFKTLTDELLIYTTCYGRELYLKCVEGTVSSFSNSYIIPAEYDNPYEYVMSGNLDNQIRDLRITTDMRATVKLPGKSVIESTNYSELLSLPIEFEDVGDLIRKRLGIKEK